MNGDTINFSNKTLMVLLVVLVSSWGTMIFIDAVVFHATSEDLIVTSLSGAIFITVMIGFTVYHQRFRDERTTHLLERSGRNGFLFQVYILPFLIIFLSLAPMSPTNMLLLFVVFWVASIAVAILSAIYYYRR
ncbi:MAG: hypothetical protein K9W43_03805 [Candidatus Thorarchaeota archaeon]|nr:hypothetical protein [Candidatus Thorarchaeota archaeon]